NVGGSWPSSDQIVDAGVAAASLDPELQFQRGKHRKHRVQPGGWIAVLDQRDRFLAQTRALAQLALTPGQALAVSPNDRADLSGGAGKVGHGSSPCTTLCVIFDKTSISDLTHIHGLCALSHTAHASSCLLHAGMAYVDLAGDGGGDQGGAAFFENCNCTFDL